MTIPNRKILLMVNQHKLLFFNALILLFNFNLLAQNHDSVLVLAEKLIKQSVTLTQSQPDSSLFIANRAIDLSQEIKNTKLLQNAYQQLGYVYYNQNQFEKAAKHFNISYSIAKERNDLNGQALALNRLGNVSQLQNNYLLALEYYLLALELNTTSDNKPEIARTLVNLANTYSVIGQYQRSIEHFLRAMDIHEEVGEREGLAWTSLGIARLFKRLELLDRAMQYAQSSLEYYREIEQKTGNSVGVTLCLNEIGSIYHRLGNYEKALEYTQMVLEINIKTENIYGQAANNISLGKIFLDQGKDDLARKYLSKAIELKNSIGDSLDIALLYRHMGQVEMRSNKPQVAHKYFTQSLNFAKKHRLIPDISEAYLSLSLVYKRTKNFEKSLEAFQNHTIYKDSLNSSDIARLEMQYEFEKREKEQELLVRQREALQEARLERQRVVMVFFIIAFLLAGSLAAFIFYGYREKKRINLLLIEQNNEISRQKQEIESQKEEIEQQRDFVTKQRDQIAEQQRLITDSITYASRIQTAVLPGESNLADLPWESFVFYKPKNIVSGDFYWASELSNGKILLAAADCTGHGVPGAFMSMLGITLLREIAGTDDQLSPAQILTRMREMVLLSLNQQTGKVDQADGMDMAIVLIEPKTLELEFAGAYLQILIVREGSFDVQQNDKFKLSENNNTSVLEIKGDKMPIGHHISGNKPFNNQKLSLQKNDMLYLFSDGYVDQFGGDKNTKFLMQNFRNLLVSINAKSSNIKKELIADTIEQYQGSRKQVDDMLVLGVRIS
jgi:serine phosphatase RsbU (regulator of sigma subunit)